MARAMRRDARSSPKQIEDIGEILLVGRVDDVGGARAFPAHAHVERSVLPEREASIGFVELHGRDADIQNNAVETRNPRRVGNLAEGSEACLVQREARVVGGQRRRCRNGAWVAIEPQNPGSRNGEDRPAVPTGAERSVEIHAASARRQGCDSLLAEHGNVPGRSAGGEGSSVAAVRHQSRAPEGCGEGAPVAACPELSCFRRSRTRFLASAKCARKRPGSQI